ncbi:MAG: aspartate aminotransferase [Gammaproteobacteria bacterium]|nr:aspartate aminotransferase [Gammaproteobacteria bacterium]OUT95859.1 MAG: aspartate aminotransferase [Gammaproteobacteria bacterium TMED36]|tara:strand:- start:11249 stop:12430 length:1182 start_codon:yes stop_codon:yes gene_type:complete
MKNPISERVKKVKPSATIAISSKAMEMRSAGIDVISMSAGEPDFDTPEHIKDAAKVAMDDGMTKYTQVDGLPELKQAIINKFRDDNELIYHPENILVSTGAKQTLYNLFQAILGPGDEVIIISPYWVSYPDMVLLADAKPIIVDTFQKNDFSLDLSAFKEALNERTKLVIINSPSNPTGITFGRSDYESIGTILEDHPDVYVATDDMYEYIYWGEEPFVSFAQACPSLFDRTITINGVSKSYAMTGWRIGYCGGPTDVIGAMKKVQSQSTSNPSSISQAATIAALNGSKDEIYAMIEQYKLRHDYLCNALNDIDGFKTSPGSGAFYLFPDVKNVIKNKGFSDDVELSQYFIEEAKVAVIPGSAFGSKGYIRLSYATSHEQIKEAVERISNSLN